MYCMHNSSVKNYTVFKRLKCNNLHVNDRKCQVQSAPRKVHPDIILET